MSARATLAVPEAAPASPRVWWLLALVIVAAALIRLRLLNVPFERDEGEYAYAGQLILAGVPPYTLLYNMKLPGTYLAYALSMLLFGQTVAGARLGLLIATSLTCLGVFRLARRFVGDKNAVAGAAGYAILALSTEFLGPFGHATHFVALFAVWGLVILSGALEGNGLPRYRYVAAGVVLGFAVMMKQPGAVFLGVAAVWVAAGPSNRKVRDLVFLLAGAAVPFGLLGLWLAATGTLGAFWFWVVRYGQAYGTLVSLAEGFANLRNHVSWFMPQGPLLWVLAGVGLIQLFQRRLPKKTRIYLGALLVLSFAGVCPGLYFREHYFLVFVPAVAVLIAVASEALRSIPRVGRWLAPALVLASCAQSVYAQREVFLRAGPDQIPRIVYGGNLFTESVVIGHYLGERTGPEDRLFIFGSEPQILFYARRLSATGVVYMYPLLEAQPFASEMGRILIREVEEQRPAYAVLIGNPESWHEAPDPRPRVLLWAPQYLSENYEIVGQVVAYGESTQYLWNEAAARRPLGEDTRALVMRRKDLASAQR